MRKLLVVACVALAACAGSPTEPEVKTVPGRYRADAGGFTMGSGNFMDGQTQTATTYDVAADSSARSGFTMGSGN